MLSLMMGHAFDAALRHATKLVYARRVVTRTHVASGDHDSKSVYRSALDKPGLTQAGAAEFLGVSIRNPATGTPTAYRFLEGYVSSCG